MSMYMVLIFSCSEGEYSTNIVIDWIWSKNTPFKRLNGSDFDNSHSYQISMNGEGLILKFEDEDEDSEVNPNEIKSTWYRRWGGIDFIDKAYGLTNDIHLNHQIRSTLYKDFFAIKEAITDSYACDRSLNKESNTSPNKLNQLRIASNLNLNIPSTIVTSSRKHLLQFSEKFDSIITKSIQDFAGLSVNSIPFALYTSTFSIEDIKSMPTEFFPSFFQEKIEKEFEIRSFYLEGKFYSMAIFSQSDQKTTTDFRNYNFDKPNRNIPFKIPAGIEEKLHSLMMALDLNCGSIDLIKASDGRYVFLEVNPIGQFGMVSNPCNYYLEEIVAEYLVAGNNIN
ncbi:grasp-with-spasm system ATP-grasp peptide maturase [Roseivirga sp. BDSF3-8]|uniref:grasp-with-spasm system ATP-grasp peptide maturase n=1 Tax=Roseivirga sp. BDSF3-8 TaxID=3241598 RepID=UPI003531B4F7